MHDEQRQKIKSMRLQGIGYRRIADTIGLTRDSVRGYCRRNGLGGYGKELIKEHKNIIEEEFLFILCRNCGTELQQHKLGRKRKYCGMECKREWEKAHRKQYAFHCEYCGKEFKSLGTKKRKYCNQECYTRDRFWREEDAKEVASKIIELKRVGHVPKWLKDLIISDGEK